ncbi:lymphocyte antigen 6E-like [Mauremys mutica]|uniref:lymphocyte antigen 6E-like n=1 Tax=Mauremys mutica TaxID=74926 RepID=UPI001D16B74B|nr:lymphocyte antigen 6E-like [Mauremys mutica]XP_044864203.1 lymphocyte antigen 6E-like [Mauremys mutica]
MQSSEYNRAHSLVCFTCKDASSNWRCLAPTMCRSAENNCVTEYSILETGGHSGQSISKQCSVHCPGGVSCCSFSFCNFSRASSVKVSYSVLAMVVLASFVYVRAGL